MMYEYSYVNYILSHEHVEKGKKVWKKAKLFPIQNVGKWPMQT